MLNLTVTKVMLEQHCHMRAVKVTPTQLIEVLDRAIAAESKLAESVAAVKTLNNLGYTYHGAELWKPPLGKPPQPIANNSEVNDAAFENFFNGLKNRIAFQFNGTYKGFFRESFNAALKLKENQVTANKAEVLDEDQYDPLNPDHNHHSVYECPYDAPPLPPLKGDDK